MIKTFMARVLKIFLIVILALGTDRVLGQRKPGAPNDSTANLRNNEVRSMVEIPAEFPGGRTEFNKYVARNLKYPKKALKQQLVGNVYVEFVVNTDGSIITSTVKAVRKERLGKASNAILDPDCQREAVRLIKGSPRWAPATRNGRPEQQAMIIGVPFIKPNG